MQAITYSMGSHLTTHLGFHSLCCFDVKRTSHPSGSRRGDMLPAPSGSAAPEKPQYPRMAKSFVQSQGYPPSGCQPQ